MSSLLERFLDPHRVSLKICGVTGMADASRLVEMDIPALGVNFWPRSSRFLDPANAAWLAELAGRILRVGVFVNEPIGLPLRLVHQGWLDVIQLHGDETREQLRIYQNEGITVIKAVGVRTAADLEQALEYGAQALLLDTPAPGVYGGTGRVFDWTHAAEFMSHHPQVPVILAGGITPLNAAQAAALRPAALDVASGAEIAPGRKDFTKVADLLTAIEGRPSSC